MFALVQISKSALVQMFGDVCVGPNIKIGTSQKDSEFFQKSYHSQILVNNLVISLDVVLSYTS